MIRKVVVITGTRAEYGVLRPLLEAIQASRMLDLSLIVTSMHLSTEFGNTRNEIERDGYSIAAIVKNVPENDSNLAMANSVGKCILGMAETFHRLKPDIILVTGDRGEMLAGAIAAGYMNIPIAHIHGGDVSGNIDDAARHAITKFAHIHFPATRISAERIAAMGEERHRIHMVGALALDSVLNQPTPPKEYLMEKYGIGINGPDMLILQHPVTSESEDAALQMSVTLEALKGYRKIVIFPNADSGGRRMIEVIKEWAKQEDFQTFENVPHADFLGLLKTIDVLVGNSSSGVIEAPSFGLPVVNIGTRQSGRERACNLIDCSHDQKEIRMASEKALSAEFREMARSCANPYGDGKTTDRIIKVLEETKLDESILNKKWSFERD